MSVQTLPALAKTTHWLMSTPTVAFRAHLPPVQQQLGIVEEPLHELPDAPLLSG